MKTIPMAFAPQIVELANGDVLCKPGRPIMRFTVAQAAARAGCSVTTIHRLIDMGILNAERISPRSTRILADSLEKHIRCSADPEYWTEARRLELRKAREAGRPRPGK